MKKNAIIIVLLLIGGFFWFRPVFSPLSSYTDDCIKGLSLSRTAGEKDNLGLAEQNFNACKIALAENDKRFKDSEWKKKSWCNIYKPEGFFMIFISPVKFKSVRESNAILDKMTLDAIIISSARAKIYKDENSATQILNELQSIVSEYKAYAQLNSSSERVEAHKAFIKENFFN